MIAIHICLLEFALHISHHLLVIQVINILLTLDFMSYGFFSKIFFESLVALIAAASSKSHMTLIMTVSPLIFPMICCNNKQSTDIIFFSSL